MSFLKKYIWVFLVIFVIGGIGTCNYCMNTSDQKKQIENPEVGDCYVFKDFPEGNKETIMKIKAISDDKVEFYLPYSEIIGGFRIGTSESAVKKADKKGQMFSDKTIIISREEIKRMFDNDNLSGAVKNKPRIEWVF